MSYLDPLALSIRFGNRNNLGDDKRWTDKPNPLHKLNQEQFTYIYEDSLHFLYGRYIPVIFQVASLLAALTHPGHIVIYAPGDSLPCRRDAS
ncbi:hypothetical protein CKY10_10875 [Photorhabdus sp. HUG-39]|nr:hypothetical protein CKY10_10875 [Photorhabdus sp. HUG-39]